MPTFFADRDDASSAQKSHHQSAVVGKKRNTSGDGDFTQESKKVKSTSSSSENGSVSDGVDGMPAELLRFQTKLFRKWLDGRVKFDIWHNFSFDSLFKRLVSDTVSDREKIKVLKEIKFMVASTKKGFLQKVIVDKEMSQFKKQQIDPVTYMAIEAVNEYVLAEAAKLREEILEDMLLDPSDDDITRMPFYL